MNEALRSDVQTASDLRGGAGDPGVTYTIKVLSSRIGEDGKELRTVLFRRTAGGESVELGAETDAPNLMAHLPELLDAAMEIQRNLGPAPRTAGTPASSLFSRFAEESRLLRRLTGGAETEAQEVGERRAAREAMVMRDAAWEAIRHVLPPERRSEIDALVGFHEQPGELARSLEAIAALVDAMLGDPEDSVILGACDLDGGYADALRRQAAALRADLEAARREGPERRGLLRLIGTAYRALRTDAVMAVARADFPLRSAGRREGGYPEHP